MNNLTLFCLLSIVFCCTPKNQKESAEKSPESIQRIAFGSCSRQSMKDAQLWKEVIAENPDVWIWLGDNVYADTEDMEKMKADYDLQKSHPDYQRLLQKTAVVGTWDDHDFGANDIGKEYPMKDESRDLLFDFLDVPKTNEAWARKGAYQTYTYGFEDKRIKLILLDVRYFRDSLKWTMDPKTAQVNEKGDILGEDQWTWLSAELDDAGSDMFILGSGIQVISKDHRFEKWANFPRAKDRLLNLITDKVEVPVLFLSGDRHISEVSKLEIAGYDFPLYDVTSSSLTTPWGEPAPDVNSHRVGEIIYPTNFAIMDIDWNEMRPSLKLKFVGKDNEILQDFSVSY